MAQAPEPLGHFEGQGLAAADDLKITVAVRGQQVEQLGMRKGLTPQNAEEAVAGRLGLVDEPIHSGQVESQLLGLAARSGAAPRTAIVDDRKEKYRRKKLASSQPPLMPLDRTRPLVAQVEGQLPEQSQIGFAEQAPGKSEDHGAVGSLGNSARGRSSETTERNYGSPSLGVRTIITAAAANVLPRRAPSPGRRSCAPRRTRMLAPGYPVC